MDTSLDRLSESLKLLQPLKTDDRQNLFTSTSAIGTSDSLAHNSCSMLAHNVQDAIDHWTGKRAIEYAPTISVEPKRNLATAAAISIIKPQSAKLLTAPAVVQVLPIAIKTPANLAPKSLAITGIKSSYDVNSKLAIDNGLVSDSNGWKDLSKVDFWLTDAQGKRIELADATAFTTTDPNSAKFAYSANLTGIVAGNYNLNAVAVDKAGAKSNTFSQSIAIKPVNLAPKSLAITGIKSSYDVNSKLAIDNGLVSDSNGWKDLSKVDFWLTDAQGKRIELADATAFTTTDPNSAKFAYSANLTGIVAGNYNLNAVAVDKAGAKSNTFSQSIAIKPVNLAPKSLAITGIKSSYDVNSKLAIDNGLVSDSNGWKDLSKVDFWLTDAQGKRIELADANAFTTTDPNSAKFAYSANLTGIVAGNYNLNAVAVDKVGAKSNTFSQSIAIKPVNLAPQVIAITGAKSSYELNSTLSIDSGLVSDSNGWKDLSKVDFWLTDAQGKRIELADANTFTTKDSNSAKFTYSSSLNSLVAGEYKLNAIAYDKANLASNLVSQSLVIKPMVIKPMVIKPMVITPVAITPAVITPAVITPIADNIKPQGLALEGIKSIYEPNTNLAIDFGYIFDSNGWQDIRKVDLWLTNSQGQRFELPDVSKFDYNAQNWAQFNQYSANLSGIPNGDYKLNAIAYDKSESASDLFTQSFKIDTIVRPPLNIKIADPFNAFSVQQKQAFEIAVSNWERIITRDKDTSGIFNIVVISSAKDLNGNSYLGTTAAGEAYTDSVINSRSNIANDQVLTAGAVDINGVDYHNRINLNYYYLQGNPSTTDLVFTFMHEIGHTLGLDHEHDESLMGPLHLQDSRSVLSSSSFAELEKLGYVVDRNAQIKWA